MFRIKICGLTSREDALLAAEYGADAVGVVHVRQSKRFMGLEDAAQIFEAVSPNVARVIVAAPGNIEEALMLAESRAGFIQLHGMESLDYVKALRDETTLGIIKKITVDEHCVDKALAYAHYADAILLDTSVNGVGGGTGVVHDWRLSRRVVEALDKPVVLAGGLNPSNLAMALNQVKPYAVDVSSGVESRPGVKDENKIREYIRIAKENGFTG